MKTLLFALLAALAIAGCASRYEWMQPYPASAHRYWVQVSRAELFRLCGISPAASPDLVACAIQIRETDTCWMYSTLDETSAKMPTNAYRTDIYAHEARHCEGWRHG